MRGFMSESQKPKTASEAWVLSPAKRGFLRIAGFLLGFFGTAFLVFQVLFLSKVIPHGGIW